jgi:metallo-beta-lactamase family protein
MLGSASIQVEADGKRVVFSGDIGPVGAPVLKDAEPFSDADLVFLESTYGDRDHRSLEKTLAEFASVVRECVAVGGKMLVPAFAIGRAQQLIYHLNSLFDSGAVPEFPVHLDSPMAFEAQTIMLRHPELFDEEATALHQRGELRRDYARVKVHRSADDSRQLNDLAGPRLIIAGSGMCNGGRILHHLKHNLWNPTTHLLICGYQSEDSIGRRIVEGARRVTILGEEIAVAAKVHTLGGFSAHAGQTELLRWFAAVGKNKPRVVLTHGEEKQRAALAEKIRAQSGITATLPKLGDVVQI